MGRGTESGALVTQVARLVQCTAACQPNPQASVCAAFTALEETLRQARPEDFGLDQVLRENEAILKAGQIIYCEIADTPSFNVSMFVLPPSSVIPLHDHPGMNVLTGVLVGTLHAESYDVVSRQALGRGQLVTTTRAEADDAAAGEVLQLTPTKRNIHTFTAKELTAFVDISTPNYDDRYRPISYYQPVGPALDGSPRMIVQYRSPPEFVTASVQYRGPAFGVNSVDMASPPTQNGSVQH